MRPIPKSDLKKLREIYRVGTRVKLVRMSDPYSNALSLGEYGTVISVDDIGTIHIHWDCGSSLGIIYGEDICERTDQPE